VKGSQPLVPYWVYRTRTFVWRRREIRAGLVSPTVDELKRYNTFVGALQDPPFGVEAQWVFSVPPAPHLPDNLRGGPGFLLNSQRLVRVMQSFGAAAEYFPATLVNRHGRPQTDFDYAVFHLVEGTQPAMDEVESGWTGERATGIPRLVLDLASFEQRPIFVCDHIYVTLIRDDVKRAIQAQGLTGFEFCRPERFSTGRYGLTLEFEET